MYLIIRTGIMITSKFLAINSWVPNISEVHTRCAYKLVDTNSIAELILLFVQSN